MLCLVERPFSSLSPDVLSLQVRPSKVKEPDQAIFGGPLALPRVAAIVKAEVCAHSLFTLVERGISMLGMPVAIERENLRMVAVKGRQGEQGGDPHEAVGPGRLSPIRKHVVRRDLHFRQEAAQV